MHGISSSNISFLPIQPSPKSVYQKVDLLELHHFQKTDVPIIQKKSLIFQSTFSSSWEWQLVMRKPPDRSQWCKCEIPLYMTDDSY